mmetsp:Transcript_23079/g.32246  ORF Transcript_23079/g.32246 Transcript_23079/m.32246 type:complete len:374 (+) Transcript_23079:75-1196(+)
MSDCSSTKLERQGLIDNGFLIIRDLIPRKIVDNAVRAINSKLVTDHSHQTLASGHEDSVTDLWNKTPLRSRVNELTGPLKQDPWPVKHAQIALVAPGSSCGKTPDEKHSNFVPWKGWENCWHIDGLADPHNAFTPKGEIHGFTALVGVLLSDVAEPLSGELVVYPGSHYNLARIYGREPANLTLMRKEGTKSLEIAKKEQQSEDSKRGRNSKWPTPVHFTGKAGDVVICNYLLAHNVAPNRSANIRYAVYFRVHSTLFPEGEFWKCFRPVAMANPWHDWSGLRDVSCPARQAGRHQKHCTCLEDIREEKRSCVGRVPHAKQQAPKKPNRNRINVATAISMFPNLASDSVEAIVIAHDGDADVVIGELLKINIS